MKGCLGFFKVMGIFLVLLIGALMLLGGGSGSSIDTIPKVNPTNGCLTHWSSESSRSGQSTRAYDGRRLDGERQYLVEHPTEGKIWVWHFRIENNSCVMDLN